VKYTDPAVRHDMVLAFDITDGNPNGDPDADNRPRVDPETDHGIVTDVSLKRKIRDTLPLLTTGDDAYGIYVTAGAALDASLAKAYEATSLAFGTKVKDASSARRWLCEHYVDIRLFGGVVSLKQAPTLGQIRGPLQVSFARSVDPVAPFDHSITRVAQQTVTAAEKKSRGPFANKWTIPYGLYVATLGYSAARGAQTGVTERDLQLLYKVLAAMFDHTSSAARANMATRSLHVFSHSDAFGAAPMHSLVDRVRFTKRSGVNAPRSFSDYEASVDLEDLPSGIVHDQIV